MVSVLFFRNFKVGREAFIFIFCFEAEVLMLKYNKTYPYLLSFLHPSVQVTISYINILKCRKQIFSDN